MQLRYAFRLYPDAAQQAALARAFGCARVVFNDAVRAREDARGAGQPFPTAGQLSTRLITEAKRTPERAWLGGVSAVVLQQSLRDAETAYRNFFASLKGTRKGPKLGAPRFKSRKDARQSIRFTANARWTITGSGRLNLPKIGAVKVKWSRTLPAVPTSVTVVKDASGRYFASFVIDTDPAADATRMPETNRTIGIDLGLTHFAVLSDGTKIDSPRFLRRAEKKLKKAQRELSRKQKGSKNRAKARLKVARAHAKVADARREFHHQLSTKLISENQGIAVEDLAVKALARTRLAKSVHDAGWSSFISMLEYKAERYGRTLVKIGRFEPTSQTCSTCGVKDGPKPLNVREWSCSACGTVHDRDINAAINVKTAAGLAVSACGAPVRPGAIPAQREETGSHSLQSGKARILALQGDEHVNRTVVTCGGRAWGGGEVYTTMFPARVDRVVLDGVIAPDRYGPRLLRGTEKANRHALRDWAAWTAAHDTTYGLGRTRAAVLAAVDRVQSAAARTPLRIGDHRVDAHGVPLVVFNGLSQDNDTAYGDFAQGVRDLLRAAGGHRVDPSPWLAEVLGFMLTGADSPYGSVQMAIVCGDIAAPRDPEVYWRDVQHARARDTLFGPVTNNLNPCAFWDPPRERPTTVRDDLPALLVNATGDPRTTYEGATAVRRAWPSSRLLTLRGADQHAVYGVYGAPCVDTTVNAYLATGRLPASDITCR